MEFGGAFRWVPHFGKLPCHVRIGNRKAGLDGHDLHCKTRLGKR